MARRWIVLLALVWSLFGATTTVGAATYTYDGPAIARIEAPSFEAVSVVAAPLFRAREGSASPSSADRGPSTTPHLRSVATEAAGGAARGGESAAAATGRQMHTEFDQQLRNLSEVDPRFQPGLKSGPNRPDGFFDGQPIELKPDTPSGIRAGQSQLTRYMNAFDSDTGYLVLYGKDGSFRMGQVMVR